MTQLANYIEIGWLIFWLYWFISAIGTKKNIPRIRQKFAALRLLLFIAVIFLFRESATKAQTNGSYYVSYNNSVLLGIGIVLFLSGLGFAIWARLYLGKNWGMPMSEKLNPELVTSGPYRYVRHPIYTGMLVAILGSALTISLYWFFPLLISTLYFYYSATVEEKLLTKQFPKDYPDYKQKTKMLLPFIF